MVKNISLGRGNSLGRHIRRFVIPSRADGEGPRRPRATRRVETTPKPACEVPRRAPPARDDKVEEQASVHRILLKSFPNKPAPGRLRGWRSTCTAWAYLIKPIAVENCGFSKALVRPDMVWACADPRRNAENVFRQIVDSVEQTAAAGDENAFAEVVEERFLFERALEELKSLAQPQVNDRVQRLALDFFPGETGIVLQQDRLARESSCRGRCCPPRS